MNHPEPNGYSSKMIVHGENGNPGSPTSINLNVITTLL
jgi:hypothetical protein